jgi:hypothetical protein
VPLEDLIPLGYEVSRPVADLPITDSTVWGHGKQWWLKEGEDEEALVAAIRNYTTLAGKLETAQTYFTDNYVNWPTMTAQQKDAANRQAQRALANIIRHIRDDMSTEGV